MVKHIVIWKLDESYMQEEKENIKNTIREKLLALSGKIDVIKSLSVQFNSKEASTGNFDIMLDTTFSSFADLNTYQVHPEHLKVGEYVKSVKPQRACIDFEF